MSAISGAQKFIAEARRTVVYEFTPVDAADNGRTQDSIALLSRTGHFEALGKSDGQVLPLPACRLHRQVNVFARPI
jgi:hypothetical protein